MSHASRRNRLPYALALLAILEGCGGGGGDATPTPPTPTPGAIAVALSTGSATVTAGNGSTATATVTRTGSFTGAVALAVEGAPSGVSASLNPSTIPAGSTTSALTVTVAAGTAPGTHTLTVRATGQGVSAVTASFTLTITAAAAPDFTLSVPASVTVQQGQQGTATVSIARSGGFTGEVSLVAGPAPQDVQISTAPNPAPGGTATITITPQLTSTPGTYPITVTGNTNGVIPTRTAQFDLVITAPPAAGTLTLTPASVSVVQGQSVPVTVTLARGQGVTGNVSFTLENTPPNVTGTFDPNPTAGNTSTLTLNVGLNQPPGVVSFQVRATIGASSTTATLQLNTTPFVPPDFALAASPAALAVTAGNSATSTIAITRSASFTGEVALTTSGAPAGVTATMTPASAAGASSTLNITTTAGATPGVYPITVTGTGAGVTGTRSTTVSLTVNAPAGGGNVQWRFCRADRVPIWFGTRAGTVGAWTQVTQGANSTFTVPFAQNGQVAYVHQSATGFDVTVLNLTPAEAVGTAAEECRNNPATRSVNGSIAGVSAPRGVIVMMGGSGFSLVVPPALTTYNLTGVASDRLVDLLAYRVFIDGANPFQGYEFAILRRNLNPANGATLPVLDFGGGEVVNGAGINAFFDGFGADPFLISTTLFTSNGVVGTYQIEQAAATSPRTIWGLPSTARQAGDLFRVLAATTHPTTPRQLLLYSNSIVSGGMKSFGPILDPATVTVLGSAPVRIRAQAPWQAAYNLNVGVTFQQAQTAPNSRTVTLNGSFDFFGAGGWTLEVPDFTGVPGWNPDWMLRPGVSTSHTTSAIGLLAGSSPIPADGVELRTGQRIGTVTP